MANDYNISTTAWGKDSDELMLSEGLMKLKITGDTSFKEIGFIGDIKFSTKNEYKAFEYGLPKKIIAKKKIKQSSTLTFKMSQIESNKLALALGGYVDSTTVTDHTRAVIRSKSLSPLECSITIQSELNDGRPFDLYIRKGIIAPETIDLVFNADDWNGVEVSIEVVPDEEPLVTNFDWPCLNAVKISGTNTASSKDITVSSTTGVTAGFYAYNAAAGFLGIVDSVTTDSKITLDTAIAAANSTAVDFKFIDPDKINEDDIAYTLEEDAA